MEEDTGPGPRGYKERERPVRESKEGRADSRGSQRAGSEREMQAAKFLAPIVLRDVTQNFFFILRTNENSH